MPTSKVFEQLGYLFDPLQTDKLITALEAGEKLRYALELLPPAQSLKAIELLKEVGLYRAEPAEILKVLYTVRGAQAHRTLITPVWTLPGYLAQETEVTSGVGKLIRSATSSVVCATYNFGETSVLQESLKYVRDEKDVDVTVYVDGHVGYPYGIAKRLPGAQVFGSGKNAQKKHIKSHAKFVIVDHQIVHITSANFSYSAENLNVEMGIRITDPVLAESMERQMKKLEGVVYQAVRTV